MVPAMPEDVTANDLSAVKPDNAIANGGPSTEVGVNESRPFASFQESWDDVRDAITETEVFILLSEQYKDVSRIASSAWDFTKKAAWIIGTSSLVLVVPLLYEIDKELGPGFDPAAPPSGVTSGSDSAASGTGSGTTAVDTGSGANKSS